MYWVVLLDVFERLWSQRLEEMKQNKKIGNFAISLFDDETEGEEEDGDVLDDFAAEHFWAITRSDTMLKQMFFIQLNFILQPYNIFITKH